MPEGSIFDVIGGPFCLEADSGNDIRWYQVRYNGMTGWSPEASNGTYFLEPYGGGSGGSSESNSGGSNTGNSGEMVSLSVSGYTLRVNPRTCAITNGAEVIRREIQYFEAIFPFGGSLAEKKAALQSHFALDTSHVELLRVSIQREVAEAIPRCANSYYLVGDQYMDLHGLGNVIFGYFFGDYPWIFEEIVADYYQRERDGWGPFPYWLQTIIDFPDDRSQRALGRSLASQTNGAQEITDQMVISTAIDVGLR